MGPELGLVLVQGKPVEPGGVSWADMLYFSFATLTTLGYGDITLAYPEGRIFAVLEACTGVLYVAFLVARLVALYSSDQNRPEAEQ